VRSKKLNGHSRSSIGHLRSSKRELSISTGHLRSSKRELRISMGHLRSSKWEWRSSIGHLRSSKWEWRSSKWELRSSMGYLRSSETFKNLNGTLVLTNLYTLLPLQFDIQTRKLKEALRCLASALALHFSRQAVGTYTQYDIPAKTKALSSKCQ